MTDYYRTAFVILAIISINYFNTISQDTIYIKNYGLYPGSRENSIPFVNRLLDDIKGRSNVVICFEKGRYDFWPQYASEKQYALSNTDYINPRFCAIVVENSKNVTIDCKGSEFIFHGKLQPFSIDNSQNVTIRNVSIDWEIPFGAESEITKVSPEYFEIKIDTRQFPYIVENEKLYFVGEGWKHLWGGVKWNDPVQFERETLEVTPGTDDDLLGSGWEGKYRAKELQEGLVRIYYNNNKWLKIGNYLVLRHGIRDHAGIFINQSKDIILENIYMHSNSGLGYLAQYCENLTYINVNCLPSSRRRIISGHDDGLHFSNCRGQILVQTCTLKGLMDDSFNVHGSYVTIAEKLNDKTLVCKFPHFQSVGMKWAWPGDKIAFVDGKNMQVYGIVSVVSTKILTPESFEISFDTKIPDKVKIKDALQNITWEPDVTIKGCYFGNHRARGVLVSTGGKVVIDGNTFESSGSAIVFPCDITSYFENGPMKDAIISNNYFKASCLTSNYMTCEGIISISREGHHNITTHFPLHRNIQIFNNTFELYDYPALFAYSVKGITFNNNILKYSNKHKPWHYNKANLTFNECEDIEVKGNKIENGVLGKNIRLVNTARKSLKMGKNQVFKVEN